MSDGSDASASSDGANRRAFQRLRADEVGLAAARLTSGAEIRLIDLSRGGAQFETDRRFLPNSSVSLRLLTHDSTIVVHGRVVRSRIVRLESGGLGYNVAIAFNELLKQVIHEQPSATDTPDQRADTHLKSDAGPAPLGDPTPAETGLDVTAEEREAFDAAAPQAPAMLTVTAAVNSSSAELLDMFNGNDW